MSTMSFLGQLARVLPETPGKDVWRLRVYRILSKVRRAPIQVTYDGLSWHMTDYPFIGGTGLEPGALDGYVAAGDIHPGDVVMDLGAFTGDYTIYAALRAGPTGKVIAFEPDPISYQMLVRNIAVNKLNNVIAIRKGIWSSDGFLRLSGCCFWAALVESSEKKNSVPVCSLNSAIKDLNSDRVHFLKMDIEGGEIPALQGAGQLLARGTTVAIAAYHKWKGETTAPLVQKILESQGYRTWTCNPSHLTVCAVPDHLSVEPTTKEG